MGDNIDLANEYKHVVSVLEEMETKLRIKHIPSLVERAPPLEADDLKKEDTKAIVVHDGNDDDDDEPSKSSPTASILVNGEGSAASASLRRRNLKSFSLTLLFPPSPPFDLSNLTLLDVSHNELTDIPGLQHMPNLETLNLERNWFNALPLDIGKLQKLTTLNAARNFLRPNEDSLRISVLKGMKSLQVLNLLYNQKCGRTHHLNWIHQELPQVSDVKMTLWEKVGDVEGRYVGKSAALRNPHLLRSQLEPYKAITLRKRLVQDFGQTPTDAALVDRGGVMQRLLQCYENEGYMTPDEISVRPRVYLEGVPVCRSIIDDLLLELRAWTEDTGGKHVANKNRERPTVDATNYMILRSPKLDKEEDVNHTNNTDHGSTSASRRAIRKAKKLEKYKHIWELAQTALQQCDPVFAKRCTELAVTYGFKGSPHVDKQNCGPFYGLSLGNFPDGQGGVCVECSARLVAVMNTKNRLGKVDGRYVHWVDSYEEDSERYSLIYYETGDAFVKPGPAVFDIPN